MDAVSMRRVATALGSAPMTLYTYVPGRDELVDLMLDGVYREVPVGDADRARAQWRDLAGPVLGQVLDPADYPLAVRVGGAAGQTQGAAWDAAQAFDFGVQRVLDGLAPLFER